MSEKKEKVKRGTISLPVYDINKLMEYVNAVCNDFGFDSTRLVTYMVADWVNCFETSIISKRMTENEAFFAYLSSVSRSYENLSALRKEVQNEK